MNKTLLSLFLLFFYLSVHGQDCTNTEPILNLSFGRDNSNQLPGESSYSKLTLSQPGVWPPEGYYALVKNTVDVNPDWINLQSDYAGIGNMMLVNGALSPGEFFRKKIRLCSNSSFYLVTHTKNLRTEPAADCEKVDLTYTLETLSGEILATINTGPIPESYSITWLEKATDFRTPAGVNDVVLRISTNTPGGCGNDFAIDDIYMYPCRPVINSSIALEGTAEKTVCHDANTKVKLEAAVSGNFFAPVFQWQVDKGEGGGWENIISATTMNAEIALPTTTASSVSFRLLVAEDGNINSDSCRFSSVPNTISFFPEETVSAGPDKETASGVPVKLGETTTADVNCVWEPSEFLDNPNILNPTATPNRDITYKLKATTKQGCLVKIVDDQVTVKVRAFDQFVIPNAFTPNADGINDVWKIPQAENNPDAIVTVYNRNGNVVFKSKGYSKSWDGKFNNRDIPSGSYYYMLQVGEKRTSGWVLVSR